MEENSTTLLDVTPFLCTDCGVSFTLLLMPRHDSADTPEPGEPAPDLVIACPYCGEGELRHLTPVPVFVARA